MAEETPQADSGAERPLPENASPPQHAADAVTPSEPAASAAVETPEATRPPEPALPAAGVEAPGPPPSDEVAPPTGSGNTIEQAELDALTSQFVGVAGPQTAAEPAGTPEPTAGPEPAALADAAVVGATTVPAPAAHAAPFSEPELAPAGATAVTSIDLLNDVRLDVKIELGRTSMYIEDVLRLGVGSVVELDKLAGDPVDIFVSERLIAHGEVLVLNDNFCVRINDIHSPIPELEAN
jgi:flagellar motor switch protein FliN/FliY